MKIHVIDKDEAFSELLQFNIAQLKEYLDGGRQDVLDNTDIFCENVRSVNIPPNEKDFSLFTRVDTVDAETVVIFPIYLELFQFTGSVSNIYLSIEKYCKRYKDNKVVFFWNHDVDFSHYNEFVKQYPNARIINYNTWQKTVHDIVVPFWTMGDISELVRPKKIFASFRGANTHLIRLYLRNSLRDKISDGYHVSFEKLPYEEYREQLAESIFGLCPRGAGLSSYRFFECFHTGTIPVLFADSVELPYSEEIEYDKMIVRIEEVATQNYYVLNSCLVDNIYKYEDRIKMIRENRWRFTLRGIQEYVHRRLQ